MYKASKSPTQNPVQRYKLLPAGKTVLTRYRSRCTISLKMPVPFFLLDLYMELLVEEEPLRPEIWGKAAKRNAREVK